MKKTLHRLLVALALIAGIHPAAAQGTAFTYQGQLQNNGSSVSGSYDLTFTLFNALTGGSQVGTTVTTSATAVNNGLFTVTIDFGSGVFTGANYWLAIGVRAHGGGSFNTLTPRQPLTPTPYAIFAAGAASANGVENASISSQQLNTPGGPTSGQVLSYNGTSLSWTSLNSAGGLTLPYSGTASSSSSLFTLNNTGSGPVATLLGGVNVGSSSVRGVVNIYGSVSSEPTFSLLDQRPSGGFYSIYGGSSGLGNLDIVDQIAGRYDLTINPSGHVGIGTSAPSRPLEIFDPNNGPAQMRLSAANGNLGMEFVTASGTVSNWRIGAQNLVGNGFEITPSTTAGGTTFTTPAVTVLSSGNVSIGAPSSGSQQVQLGVGGRVRCCDGSYPAGIWFNTAFTPYGGNPPEDIGFLGVLDSTRLGIYANDPRGSAFWSVTFDTVTGNVGIGTGTAYPSSKLQVNGNASVCSLTITGGCDVAEPFHMSTQDIPKGSLVVIDEENPGQLKLSDRAYDNRVAGIVSGANGIQPGLTLSQQGVLEGGQNVALSGRVYVLADATTIPIRPGDLLTTSAAPGHAMKVTDHAKAQGAIIGKAMSSLEAGKGMVLVLVTLQ